MKAPGQDQPAGPDLVVRNAALVRAPGALPEPAASTVIRAGLISAGRRRPVPASPARPELSAAAASPA